MSEHMIPIPSRIYNAAVGGHVAGADQIIDDKTGLTLDKVAGGALEEKEYTSGSNNGMGRVVLRKNLVNGVNTLVQTMINKSNTIYVIQYDFTLGEDITIPANCVLEFDGGSISGNYYVDFRNCLNENIYYSWFKDFITCNNSLLFLNTHQQLVIDKDITITQPFTIPAHSQNYRSTSIRGIKDSKKGKCVTITCDGCSAFILHGHIIEISDLAFVMTGNQSQSAIIMYPSATTGIASCDPDCRIERCSFMSDNAVLQNDAYIASIEVYGRGVEIEDNLFQYPIYPSETEKKFPIILRPVEESGGEAHDAEGAMRAVRIRNNRYHASRKANYMIGVLKTEDVEDMKYNDMFIDGNLIDVGGALLYITCKNVGTLITNNICTHRASLPTIYMSNAENMVIEGNIFRSMMDGYYDTSWMGKDIRDIVIVPQNEGDVNGITIINNVLGSWNGSILCHSDVLVNNIIIKNNSYSKEAFSRDNYGTINGRSLLQLEGCSIKNCVIKNNVVPSNSVGKPYAVINDGNTEINNVIISNNFGVINAIKLQSGSPVLTEVFSAEDTKNKGLMNDAPRSVTQGGFLTANDIGFSYYATDLKKPVYLERINQYGECVWVDADGTNYYKQNTGTFAQKPEGWRINIGFRYFCTDRYTQEGGSSNLGIEIVYKGVDSNNQDIWVDALGRVVS